MHQIILASGSPRRKELLSQIVKDFTVVQSTYEEDMTLKMDPQKLALHLSYGKAEEVAGHFPEAIVIAADTFIIVDEKPLGKPIDLEDAKAMLRIESGKEQIVVTGLTIMQRLTKKKAQRIVLSRVFMKYLSDEEINEYVTTHNVLDKSGSYAIQEIGDKFIEKVQGSYTNIMGLPLEEVKEILKGEFGIATL